MHPLDPRVVAPSLRSGSRLRLEVPHNHPWLHTIVGRSKDAPHTVLTLSVELNGHTEHYEMIEAEIKDARHTPVQYHTTWRMINDRDEC